MTEGVGYARDLWSEAPTLFFRGSCSRPARFSFSGLNLWRNESVEAPFSRL